MLPPENGDDAPYPTILYIHGGPWGAFGNIYSIDFQLLAGAGYAVLFVNYHGSSGYGEAFGQSIQAAWGTLDYEDQMMALDHVIAEGLADPDRLGVCGISAGGYGSCWMVGQTDRFKAAVPENPVTNLVTIYSVGDIGRLMKPIWAGNRMKRWRITSNLHPSRTRIAASPQPSSSKVKKIGVAHRNNRNSSTACSKTTAVW